MHVETYPDFLTPRDKKLSLSSSVEKSSKFGWLENENEMKNEREGKTEQGSVNSIYLSIYFYMMDLLEQAPLRVPQESPFLVFTREFI